jgi:6,7-dimethyl-8-ribityllumazine synthase
MTIDIIPPAPQLDGAGLTIGIIVARYNWNVTGAMLHLAHAELHRLGVTRDNVRVAYVPGSYELAIAAQSMLSSGHYDALICFGCVMKGETRHDVVVSDAATQGIQRVALDAHIPIIFGVMCAENQQQTLERIARGTECAQAAVEMARTIQLFTSSGKEASYVHRDR